MRDKATMLALERFAFEPQTAPYSNWTTSRAAAKYIERFLSHGRRAVYGFLYAKGPHANWQTHNMTGIKEKTVDGRRVELRDAGLVRNSGETVLKDGLPTILWEVVPDPDPETFETYWKFLEEQKTLVRAEIIVTNCPRLQGEKRSPKTRRTTLDAESLQAVSDALRTSQNPCLFELRDLLEVTGFEAETDDAPWSSVDLLGDLE